jgi:hypothetical protein
MLLLRSELRVPCAQGSPLAYYSPCCCNCRSYHWRQCGGHIDVEVHPTIMATPEPLFRHRSFLPKRAEYAW